MKCTSIAECEKCGTAFSMLRAELGYRLCLSCGEKAARERKHTVVPMHKSNYMVVSDTTLLAQITRPGRGSNH